MFGIDAGCKLQLEYPHICFLELLLCISWAASELGSWIPRPRRQRERGRKEETEGGRKREREWEREGEWEEERMRSSVTFLT